MNWLWSVPVACVIVIGGWLILKPAPASIAIVKPRYVMFQPAIPFRDSKDCIARLGHANPNADALADAHKANAKVFYYEMSGYVSETGIPAGPVCQKPIAKDYRSPSREMPGAFFRDGFAGLGLQGRCNELASNHALNYNFTLLAARPDLSKKLCPSDN